MLRLVIFCALFDSIYTLTCPCQRMKNLNDFCKEPENCVAGTTFDVCGCCKVCAKAVDEICGGHWEMFGRCGNKLECVKPENLDESMKWYAKGICKPIISR